MQRAHCQLSIGSEEIESVLQEPGQIEVQCEFGNRFYRFNLIDAALLWLPNVSEVGARGSDVMPMCYCPCNPGNRFNAFVESGQLSLAVSRRYPR